MDILRNECGFTAVSMIFAIIIFMLTIPFLSYLIQAINNESFYDEQSVMNFFYFLRDETYAAIDMEVNDQTLILTLINGDEASFSQYNTVIRRQVKGKGHEIYLRNVDDFNIEKTKTGFRINITTKKGMSYEETFTFST